MRRVFVCSPLRGATPAEQEANIRLARRLCALAMADGDVAAFCPHILYTQFLDDANEEERDIGIRAGKAFLESCDEIWVYTKLGISEGMRSEVRFANADKTTIELDPECWDGVGDA